jgi:predicted dienelactone hydrolase
MLMVKRNTTVFDHYIPIPVVVGDKKHRSERVRWRGEKNMFARKSKSVVAVLVIVVLALGLLPSAQAQAPVGPPRVGLFPDSPTYAVHGPYWVGARDFVIGADSDRPLEVTVWYPAYNLDLVPEEITYTYDPLLYRPVSVSGHAIGDGTPAFDTGPYPLVIASHGHDANRFFVNYLTEHLASYGFVVMAVNHTGNATGDTMYPMPDYIKGIGDAMVYRPEDVQRQIDFAGTLSAQGGALPGLIDLEHIAVLGHSFGGYTALAAAGARVNLTPTRQWCDSVANDPAVTSSWGYFFVCTSVVDNEAQSIKLLGADVQPGDLWPAFDVSGVDAIVPISAFGMPFADGSLDNITIPALVIVGSADSLHDNNQWVYETLPSSSKAFVVFENAGHDVMFQGCDDLQKRLSWFACFSEQVWDPDRLHDRVRYFTTAFLLAELKGDADAAAALAPDAVSFPGITYEATGF